MQYTQREQLGGRAPRTSTTAVDGNRSSVDTKLRKKKQSSKIKETEIRVILSTRSLRGSSTVGPTFEILPTTRGVDDVDDGLMTPSRRELKGSPRWESEAWVLLNSRHSAAFRVATSTRCDFFPLLLFCSSSHLSKLSVLYTSGSCTGIISILHCRLAAITRSFLSRLNHISYLGVSLPLRLETREGR